MKRIFIVFCLAIVVGFSEGGALAYDFGNYIQYTNDEVITSSLGQRSIAIQKKMYTSYRRVMV